MRRYLAGRFLGPNAEVLVVLGALETAGITDLDAGDPMHWVAEPA